MTKESVTYEISFVIFIILSVLCNNVNSLLLFYLTEIIFIYNM